MVRFLKVVFFSVIISSKAQAAYPGNSDTATYGGRTVSASRAPILLVAQNGTANGYSTFRLARQGTTAGYAVTTGKTLKIVGITVMNNGGAISQSQLSCADTDIGITATGTPGTSTVYMSGMASTNFPYQVPSATLVQSFEAPAECAAGKYLQHQGSNGGSPNMVIFARGYEE